MNKATIKDLDVKGKRVLVRVDFNVPLDGERVTDDTRIRAALPTITRIIEQGGIAILMSHLGRPKGRVNDGLRLAPAAKRLEELLGRPVHALQDCIGDEVASAVKALQPGDVVLLENLRFHPEEEKNDPEFARALAALGEVYVNDAFGTAHRAHASTAGIAAYLPAVAGLLMEKEIDFLSRLLERPEHPFVAILGGAKVADKIAVLHNMLDEVDTFLIGGGMAFTFLHLDGKQIGRSLLDPDPQKAREFLEEARKRGKQVLLPVDVVIASEISADAETATVDVDHIPTDKMGLDIGPKTVDAFRAAIQKARTVLWNGPMGVFEIDGFEEGTVAIAHAVAAACDRGALGVIGGGDSGAAVDRAGVADRVTHVSTGGGASIKLLAGGRLPGRDSLTDRG